MPLDTPAEMKILFPFLFLLLFSLFSLLSLFFLFFLLFLLFLMFPLFLFFLYLSLTVTTPLSGTETGVEDIVAAHVRSWHA